MCIRDRSTAIAVHGKTYLPDSLTRITIGPDILIIGSKYYALEKASSNTYSNQVNDYKYIWNYGDSREAIWKVGFTVKSYGCLLYTSRCV